MPPKKTKASKTTKPATKGSKRKAGGDHDGDSPTKLTKVGSFNSQLKQAITEAKKEASSAVGKQKTFKLDSQVSSCLTVAKSNVYEDYSCMLNQTNIGNNNNKFYVIQLIEETQKKSPTYHVFTRWGRVGETGQLACTNHSDTDDAIKTFEKKFKDKTKNDWKNRDNFKPAPGKYTMLEMDEASDGEEDQVDSSGGPAVFMDSKVKCSLDARTILLIKLIFNDDMFIGQMSAMNLDVRKMPLGKLSKTQIAKGLEVLIEIEEVIKKKKKGNLSELCSKFYTLVPHDFGRKVPEVINTEEVVNQKKEIMMTLSDIELTQSLQKQKTEVKLHPLDEKYGKLECQLDLLPKNSKEFKMIVDFASAGNNYRKVVILDVWRVDRKGAQKRFDAHQGLLNRKLLWHGTNVAVVAAILKAGLRIMPHSGGRVGRGIYFASEHSKSAGYVGVHYGEFEKEKNVGFMFLVEVALGNEQHIKMNNCSLTAAPKGYDSVVARGQTEPNSKKDQIVKFGDRNVIVPVGKPVSQSAFKDSCFWQSEYLVYKESQARIRYLVKLSFA